MIFNFSVPYYYRKQKSNRLYLYRIIFILNRQEDSDLAFHGSTTDRKLINTVKALVAYSDYVGDAVPEPLFKGCRP